METQVASSDRSIENAVEQFCRDVTALKQEMASVIVGHDDIVEGVIMALLSGGHALLEGVPGLGKTMLVRTLAECIHADFARVQFTPDLMPADIIGTTVVLENERGARNFQFQKGPIFANIILADEINRATPKTQSALLEAMQEGSVTVAKETHKLEQPFFVLATQNPLEMEGTYPLPEAQLDRFFFKLKVKFPGKEALHAILDRTTSDAPPQAKNVIDKKRIVEMREFVRKVPLARHIQDAAIRVLQGTHVETPETVASVKQYVRYGASPRGAQTIIFASKIKALLAGRFAVSFEDIKQVAKPALRHRMLLNFEGQAEGIDPDNLIDDILAQVGGVKH